MKRAAAVAVKGVKFGYQPAPATKELLSLFRAMVNDAIRICMSEKIRGRLDLRDRIYREFQREIRGPVVLSLRRRRGRVVHSQEAQALAPEALREEADAQDGRRELLPELFHTLAAPQEG